MAETQKSELAKGASDVARVGDVATVKEQASPSKKKKPREKNNVRKLRTERMMSKAELARRAGLSTLTVDRVEKGMPCRMDTKRKILEALGLTPADRVAVFGDDD
jgi:DNA-binding XRE family transcriptional regulator